MVDADFAAPFDDLMSMLFNAQLEAQHSQSDDLRA